ncbi:MAG TPA: DUF3347 domain-containing protein, partial [Chitinophagaceae bacterium]|nr:DUF3347 domain-containing protein [Chitinophagaceae bacterium]
MKKGLIIIAVAIAAIAIYFLFFVKDDTPQTEESKKDAPLAQSKNSDAFNQPFNELLSGYFDLKDAFVNWDTAKAKAAAENVITLSKKVPYDKLQADTNIISTAKNFSDNIASEAEGLKGETSIEEQRRAFYTLSENLYNLIRTVRYDQQIIYHDKCPMAFN